ncbi:hypothetical protein AB0N73_08605 [Microbacterium sp. NPDC089189]|uniref:hypothetical protein n=1 Tax=Microbacterium sp. NPDC089189 TaxID=3154972 RepID=UPI0034444254
MDILLAFIYGGAIGAAAHAALPGRDLRGVALAPIIGTLVGGLAWLALTWAGLTTADPWLWLAAVAAPPIVTFPLVALLTRVRRAHDIREQKRQHLI